MSVKQKKIEKLRTRAREIARRQLGHVMGTMALEGQAPNEEVFNQLLEKKTNELFDELLNNPRKKLWPETEN